MFMVYTKNEDLNLETECLFENNEKKKHSLNSTHFAKNEGLSGNVNNQESDPEIEFAYNSDEDSVISIYQGTNDKKFQPKKLYGGKNNKAPIKSVKK